MTIKSDWYQKYIDANLWKIGTAYLSLFLASGFIFCFVPSVLNIVISFVLMPFGILITVLYLFKIKSWFSIESAVLLTLGAWYIITRLVKTDGLFSFANSSTIVYACLLLICFLLGNTASKEEQKKSFRTLAWVTVAAVFVFDLVGLSAVFFVDNSLVITNYGFLGFLEEPPRLTIIDPPNIVGINSAIAIVAAIFLAVDSKTIGKRILAVSSILILFPTLSITLSRNSYFSLAIALGIYVFVEILIRLKKKNLKFLISVVGALAAIFLVIFINKTVTVGMSYLISAKNSAVSQSQSDDLETETTGLGIDITAPRFLSTEINDEEESVVEYRDLTLEGGLDGFLNGRWSIWKSAVRVMANSSAKQVTIGLNSIQEFKTSPFCSTGWANHTHNSLINATVLNGAVALVLIVIFLCLTAIKVLVRLFNIDKEGVNNGLLAFCISIIGMSVLFSIFEITLFSDGWIMRNPSQIWLVLATGVLFNYEPKSEKEKKNSKHTPLVISIGVALVLLASYLLLLNNFHYTDLWRPTESGAACYSKSISDGNVAEQEVLFDGSEIDFVLLKTGTILDGLEKSDDVLIVDIFDAETGELIGTIKRHISELSASGYSSLFPKSGIQIDRNKQYRVKIYTQLNKDNDSVVVIEADYCDRSSSSDKAYYNDEAVNEIYAISFFGK